MRKRSYLGGIFILIAVVMIGEAFGLFAMLGISFVGLDIWRLAISVLLVVIILDNIPRMSYFGIIIPLAFLIAYNHQYLNIDKQYYWTIILAGFLLASGLSMTFNRNRIQFHNSSGKNRKNFSSSQHNDDKDYINVDSSFNEASHYVRSQNFKGGSVESSFGSLHLYLNEAKLAPEGANLSVESNFGSLTIYLAHGMRLNDNIETVFGGIEISKNAFTDAESPILNINGETNFGISLGAA